MHKNKYDDEEFFENIMRYFGYFCLFICSLILLAASIFIFYELYSYIVRSPEEQQRRDEITHRHRVEIIKSESCK